MSSIAALRMRFEGSEPFAQPGRESGVDALRRQLPEGLERGQADFGREVAEGGCKAGGGFVGAEAA